MLACALTGLFRSRARLEAEILVLRHQLNVLRRKAPKRVALRSIDRLVFAGLYCLAPGALDALKILKPETVIRWHRAGFRAYWRWKSSARGRRCDRAGQAGPRPIGWPTARKRFPENCEPRSVYRDHRSTTAQGATPPATFQCPRGHVNRKLGQRAIDDDREPDFARALGCTLSNTCIR